MANTLGIPEATLAQIADAAEEVNLVGTTVDGLAVSPTNPVVRSKWNERATVRVTDHPSNDGAEVGTDTSKMALFVSNTLLGSWQLGGSKLGTDNVVDGLTGGDVIIPQ